jgi:hypothetical protein
MNLTIRPNLKREKASSHKTCKLNLIQPKKKVEN